MSHLIRLYSLSEVIDLVLFGPVVLDRLEIQQRVHTPCILCIIRQVHPSLELGPPFRNKYCSSHVKNHGQENDESEPGVEHGDEEDNGDDNIDNRRENREDDVVEQVVDTVRASVHYPQDLPGFSFQMPRQGKAVQMPKELHLNLARRILIDADPEVGAQVVQQSHRPSATTLQELEEHINENPVPPEGGLTAGQAVHDFLGVNRNVEVDHPTTYQQNYANDHIDL